MKKKGLRKMSRKNNQMMSKSLIIVNDRWVLRHPAVSLFMDWMTEKNYWDLFYYFSSSPPRGCLLEWWRKSGKWERGERKEFRGHRNEAVCIIGVCTCVTEFPGIVSRLRCVITDYTSGSLHPSSPVNRLNLPYIWTCTISMHLYTTRT